MTTSMRRPMATQLVYLSELFRWTAIMTMEHLPRFDAESPKEAFRSARWHLLQFPEHVERSFDSVVASANEMSVGEKPLLLLLSETPKLPWPAWGDKVIDKLVSLETFDATACTRGAMLNPMGDYDAFIAGCEGCRKTPPDADAFVWATTHALIGAGIHLSVLTPVPIIIKPGEHGPN